MKLSKMLSLLASSLLTLNLSIAVMAETHIAGNNNGKTAPHNGLLIAATQDKEGSPGSGRSVITLSLPKGAQPDTLKAVLNGKDVSASFHQADCSGAICEEATLSSSDGLRLGKNVLYAVAKKSDGTQATSRLRFEGGDDKLKTQFPATGKSTRTQVTPPFPTASNFLPPSVAFNTLYPGGYSNAIDPWIGIGSQQAYPYPDFNCPAVYLVIVLDRQTLTEKTAAPESSPQCFTSGSAMATYFSKLTPDDLVIAGTTLYQNADAQLDTSAIGGTNYTKITGTPNYPQSYMVVGAGGAAAGSAFENYPSSNTEAFNPWTTGSLVEDANGNYNFQPSDTEEYVVSPNDPGYTQQSMIKVGIPTNSVDYTVGGWTTAIYTSPTSSGGIGGYWLLVLQRDDLKENACSYETAVGPVVTYPNCGKFFATGDSNSTNATKAYQALAAALNAVTPDQLVFLTTVGTAGYSNSFDVAATSYTDGNGNIQTAYAGQFADALIRLGGTPGATLGLGQSGSTYTFIGCYPDCGNSLNGNSVISTSLSSQQGQTGYVHGILQRSLRGFYWPTKSSQESQADEAAGGGPDFTINLVSTQQPVEWPELDSSNLLNGATSIAGQVSAYHYMSYQLITQYYIIGGQGGHEDDIHYYFTGSNNTFIDYHTFNPTNLPFPGSTGECYTWTDPVTGNPLPCFTAGDFGAVAQQVSTEIVNLVNVLQYMVNGSTNMKDIVAAGNGSAALALIGAAATIEASTLQPAPSTPVSLNVSNVLNLVGSVVDLATTIATDGLVPPNLVDTVTKIGTTIAGAFELSSAATGGFQTGGGPAPLPNPNYSFLTTIGGLANGNLQQLLTVGFDTQLDSILGDWSKLSQIGPRITDTNDVAFYSPNQVAQNVAVTLLGQGSQRSFYMSLLPTRYTVQFFPVWFAQFGQDNYPDMGNVVHINECNNWYVKPPPANTTTRYPSYANEYNDTNFPWGELATDDGQHPNATLVDWYLIAGSVNNKGKSNENIPLLDSQVADTLFSAGGLNIPFDPFITSSGPMAANFLNGAFNEFYGFNKENICSVALNYPVDTSAPNPRNTITTLAAPSSAVLGESVPLQATVTAVSSIPVGSVSFQDGDVVLGDAPLDANGNATFSAMGLSLGEHSIAAYYVVESTYNPSESAPSPLTIYANAPDMALSLSAGSLAVTYGTPSSAVTLQLTSLSGLAGTVTFGCSGLPIGMTCNFNPAKATIAAGTGVTTSFTITSSPAQAAGFLSWRGISVLLLPLSLLCLWRIRRGGHRIQQLLCLLLLSAATVGGLSACGSDSKPSKPLQETGSKTVLVNATCGPVTKSIPLMLNIQ